VEVVGLNTNTACRKRRTVRLLICFLILFVPAVSAGPAPVHEHPASRELIDATGFAGVVVVRDLAEDSYHAGHAERVDRRLIPASTFKVFNSLVALETGVIADQHSVIEWDGVTRKRSTLNQDLDLQEAFRISAVPHFQELARRIGAVRMQEFIDKVGYGNRDLSGGIDAFWLDGGLKISPREQVDFLARLVRGKLPFSSRSMAIVKEMMVTEQSAAHTLHSKTGWAQLPEAENVGWWVGWVERGSEVHVFATVLEARAPDRSFGPSREALTRKILATLEVLTPE